jgi:hypothetical protein
MNYYFTASPPQADLSAFGIVTKKQASTHILIRPMDIDDPLTNGIISIICFFVTMPLREFVSAGGELIIHAAAHLKNSQTP